MNVLQVINTAYRATVEEQDDTVVWFTQAMQNAGGDSAVLLCGNAVNYAVADQNAAGLTFGDWRQTQPARLARDVAAMVAAGIPVFLLDEDQSARGIADEDLVEGVHRVSRTDIPDLFERYDQVWRW